MGQSSSGSIAGAQIASSAITGASQTFASAQAQRTEGEFRANQLRLQAQLADQAAQDAITRGDRQAEEIKKKTKVLIGDQRAALAAQGIDPTTGSAQEIQEETAALGAVDALTIRNNAFREAFGFRQQALNLRGTENFLRLGTRANVRQTILTGGLSFIRESGSALAQARSSRARLRTSTARSPIRSRIDINNLPSSQRFPGLGGR